MEDKIRSIEAALRRAIDARGATTYEQRLAIYEAAERALTRSNMQREADGSSDREQRLRHVLAIATNRVEETFVGSLPSFTVQDFDYKDEMPMTHLRDNQTPPSERSSGSAKIWLASLALTVIVAGGAYVYLSQPQVGAGVAAGQLVDFVAESPLTLKGADGFEVASKDGYVTVTGGATLPENAWPPGVTLSSDYEKKFAGKEVTVTVTARVSATNGTDTVRVIYYTLGSGNSGFQAMPLTSDFTDIRFDYAVPAAGDKPGEDYIGISPPAGKSIDLKSILVSVKQPYK